jgi:subtilase family serine protease/subtilisin family serine protease
MSCTPVRTTVVLGALVIAMLSTTTWIQAQRDAEAGFEQVDGRRVAAREVLVKFRADAQADHLDRIGAVVEADAVQTLGRTGVWRLRSRSVTAASLLRRLANHPDVLYAEPNYVVHAFTDPNDPSFPQLWGFKNTGQSVNGRGPGLSGADIDVASAWNVSFGSAAHVVAVVDTGIDYTHPDLAANMWSAPSAFTVTIGGVPITCPAGSHGFNAVTSTCDPMDDHNHGTHVSGTIGASGQNGVGIVGVNWIAQLMGIKFLDATGSGTVAGAVNGIEFAIMARRAFAATGGANVRVLSNSWGGPEFSQTLLDAIAAAGREDMLFVAAAGNNGFSNDILPTYPASYALANVISVAATSNTDTRASFSNYGAASVHLGAPGVDVLSTTIGNSYAFSSGTSMAAPHVSGSAALVLSRCTLDTAGLKDALLGTVEPVAALALTTITGGRLDVNSAIRSCIGPPAAPSGLTAVAGDKRVILAWTGAAGATSFAVKRSVTPGGPYTVIAPALKTKAYTDTAVVNGTLYYYVVSGANTQGDSADSNEAFATPKIASDLVVSRLTVPSTAGAGATLAVVETTKNQGLGTADPSTTQFYLSRSSTITASAILLDSAHTVPALAAGAESSASVLVMIPGASVVGSYYIVAKADAGGTESESQEANNTLARPLTIGPDLVVSVLAVQATAAPGAAIVVTNTVKNQGGGTAGATTTTFYLSSDTALGAGDLLFGSRAVPELATAGVSSGATTVVIPPTVATGSYYVIAKADADNAVVETNESNNITIRNVQIGGDLVVSTPTLPATAGAGTTIVVSETTTNKGAGTIAASVTRFYMSATLAIDASAVLLSGSRAIPELAGGASSAGSTSVLIPTVATGSYYLIAKADADNAVIETQEANNTAARAFRIGGDLMVATLTLPATAAAGAEIMVSDTTRNQGGGAIMASVTRFYLSANTALDAADVLLAGYHGVPELPAGASSVASTMVMIPATIAAGTYHLFAKADADNAVAETQELNNTMLRAMQIGGDLLVSALAVPTKGAANSVIVVTDTTTNQGGGAVTASVTRYYLSTNTALDGSDIPLAGSRDVPELAGVAGNSGSTTVTIPAVAPGTYYVIAKADADNSVVESREDNNTTARSISISPDLVVASVSAAPATAAGSILSVTDVVQNQGGDASGPSRTTFYLSTNTTLDANDLLLPDSRSVLPLAAGASSTGVTAVTIPPGTAPGAYYLFAKADGDAAVPETQETNNSRYRAIQVTAGP